jgi:hypothetical protein
MYSVEILKDDISLIIIFSGLIVSSFFLDIAGCCLFNTLFFSVTFGITTSSFISSLIVFNTNSFFFIQKF